MNKYVREGSALQLGEVAHRRKVAAAQRAQVGAGPTVDVSQGGDASFDDVASGLPVQCKNCGTVARVKPSALDQGRAACPACDQPLSLDDVIKGGDEAEFDDDAVADADPRPRVMCDCGKVYRLRDPLSLPRCCPSCHAPWSTRNLSFSRAAARQFRALVERAARRGGGRPVP